MKLLLHLGAACAAAACLLSTARAGDAFQEARLVSPDPDTGEIAGTGLAIDGDRIAMGVPHDTVNGEFKGAVHMYERRPSGWVHVQKIQPAGLQRNDSFGTDVALQGDTLLVGAIGDDGAAPGCGRVYVYTRGPGGWQQVQQLVPSDPVVAAFFGDGLSIDGDTAVIGARFADGNAALSGAAYVFVRQGSVWSEQAKIFASDGGWNDAFGAAVDLSGDTIVAGSIGDDTFGIISGAAYVYRRTGNTWTEVQKLVASDGRAGARYGFDVAVDGSRIVIGAPYDDNRGFFYAGAGYVYEDAGSGFVETVKLMASDARNQTLVGRGLDLSGDLLALGSPASSGNPALFLFQYEGGGWTETDRLAPPGIWGTSHFGDVVETDGVRVVAGAPRDPVGFYGDAGSAYVFAVPPALISYCESTTSASGCVPSVTWSGEPSVSWTAPFHIVANALPNAQIAIFFYSTNGRMAHTVNAGTICVGTPHVRSALMNTSGSPLPQSDCSGSMSVQYNAWLDRTPSLVPGTRINGQFWYRDPGSASGYGFTQAIEFVVLP